MTRLPRTKNKDWFSRIDEDERDYLTYLCRRYQTTGRVLEFDIQHMRLRTCVQEALKHPRECATRFNGRLIEKDGTETTWDAGEIVLIYRPNPTHPPQPHQQEMFGAEPEHQTRHCFAVGQRRGR